jgi:hypothetical protein
VSASSTSHCRRIVETDVKPGRIYNSADFEKQRLLFDASYHSALKANGGGGTISKIHGYQNMVD